MARNAKKCDKEEKSEKLKLKKVHVYDLRVIVAVVVIHQLNIRTCTPQIVQNLLLQRFNDTVITFIRQEKACPIIELVYNVL